MEKKQHILVWRLSAMGDVAMVVPVLQILRLTHPDLKITVASKPFFEPIFKTIPGVHFIGVQVKDSHKGVLGLYKLFKQLKALEITHVADLHNVLRSKLMRGFFSSTHIPVAYVDKGRAEKKALTEASVKKKRAPLKTTHQRYADVFAQLGFPISLEALPKTHLPLSKEIESIVGKKNNLWIGVAPFAAFKSKCYPLTLLKEVLLELEKLPCQLFLFGGKEDVVVLENMAAQISNCTSVAGKSSFENELTLISHLDLMVSMDSGNGHLAAMFGVDTLTLWGVTHPAAGFTPYGQPHAYQILPDLEKYPMLPCSVYGNKVVKGYENVMESIVPSDVIKQIKKIAQKKEL